jgi:hypothetical protein
MLISRSTCSGFFFLKMGIMFKSLRPHPKPLSDKERGKREGKDILTGNTTLGSGS